MIELGTSDVWWLGDDMLYGSFISSDFTILTWVHSPVDEVVGFERVFERGRGFESRLRHKNQIDGFSRASES